MCEGSRQIFDSDVTPASKNDDALYDEIRAAVGQVRKTFEEGEEQSVLRTFMGVFFGSMM